LGGQDYFSGCGSAERGWHMRPRWLPLAKFEKLLAVQDPHFWHVALALCLRTGVFVLACRDYVGGPWCCAGCVKYYLPNFLSFVHIKLCGVRCRGVESNGWINSVGPVACRHHFLA